VTGRKVVDPPIAYPMDPGQGVGALVAGACVLDLDTRFEAVGVQLVGEVEGFEGMVG